MSCSNRAGLRYLKAPHSNRPSALRALCIQVGLNDVHRAANGTHAQPIHSCLRSSHAAGRAANRHAARAEDRHSHPHSRTLLYLLTVESTAAVPRNARVLLSAAKRAGCPLLSCSLLSEKGLARPLMDASLILRRRGTRAVSGGRLVVGGLVCEGRGREYACAGVDLVDILFQQRSAAAAARRRSRG